MYKSVNKGRSIERSSPMYQTYTPTVIFKTLILKWTIIHVSKRALWMILRRQVFARLNEKVGILTELKIISLMTYQLFVKIMA